MTDQVLMNKIKHLASKMEHERMLNFKLSGYLDHNDKKMDEIWKKDATHSIKLKKKYAYIDYGNPSYQSGKFLINKQGEVFNIKGYGKRGSFAGTVDQQIAVSDHNINALVKAIEEKAKKGHFGLTLKGKQNEVWVG